MNSKYLSLLNIFFYISELTVAALNGHGLNLLALNGSNFSDRKVESLLILGCLNLDDALDKLKLTDLTTTSTKAEKTHHAKWVKANRLCLMMMKVKYDGSRGIHEHVMEMSDLAAQLNALEMIIAENFSFHLILNSLLPEFGQFIITFNIHKQTFYLNTHLKKFIHDPLLLMSILRIMKCPN